MPIFKWIAIIVGITTVLIFIYFATLFLWLNQGRVLSSMPSELVPTAEFLRENPIVEPELNASDFYVEILRVDRELEEICFMIASAHPSYDYFYSYEDIELDVAYTEISINGQFAGRAYTHGLEPYRSMNGYTLACIDGVLENGLHIVDLRTIDSAFGTLNYMKRWVIEVNCNYENCAANSAQSSSEFSRASRAWQAYPITSELQSVAEQLLETPNNYEDVALEFTPISVPTKNAVEICFIFMETPVLSDDQYPNIGHLSINLGYEHTLFNNYDTNSNRICSDHSVPSGVNVITLQLPNSEIPYQWAIEIE